MNNEIPMPAAQSHMLRNRDVKAMALDIFHRIDSLAPLEVPIVWPASKALHAAITKRPPDPLSDDMKLEFEQYIAMRDGRVHAKAMNKFNLRSLLWAEQTLRSFDCPEHKVLREFMIEVWGVVDEAPSCYSARESIVQSHA